MKLLLDTHALIWAVADPNRLPDRVRHHIVDRSTDVLVSTASAWEVTIKRALGKLRFDDVTDEMLERHDFRPLPIHLRHISRITDLPPIHADPFDRMLVAQAVVDDLTIVTRDRSIDQYDVVTIW